MSILAHIIVIADVSEALAASDGLCRLLKTLSESHHDFDDEGSTPGR